MRKCMYLLFILFWNVSAYSAITIGTKNFTEQIILGEIITQVIESEMNVPVIRRFNLGGTQLSFEALINGYIDIYPEYTGTGLIVILKNEGVGDAKETHRRVQLEFRKRYRVEWMKPFGFNNTHALAVRHDDTRLKNVTKISELADFASELRLGCPQEFLERPDGLRNLQQGYQLPFRSNAIIGLDPGLMYIAINDNHVDVINAFSTDGRIKAFNLRLLEDDRQFFPPYEAASIVRIHTLEQYPQLATTLDKLSGQISDEEMRQMNFAVDDKGKTAREVAYEFLVKKGLVVPREMGKRVTAKDPFLIYFWAQRYHVLKLLKEHLYLTLVALTLAVIVSIPAGIALTRFEKIRGLVFTVINTFQTIPSLALLGFLVPVLGIGRLPAIVALFLYALLPLVRNTYTGIREIDPKIIEASQGIGLTNLQILRKVEMPIALPMIIAGIRTSTVIIVGTATLAALIGAGGLGDPIFRGISSVQMNTILLGAAPAALLAIFLDRLLQFCERRLVSKGLRIGK